MKILKGILKTFGVLGLILAAPILLIGGIAVTIVVYLVTYLMATILGLLGGLFSIITLIDDDDEFANVFMIDVVPTIKYNISKMESYVKSIWTIQQ